MISLKTVALLAALLLGLGSARPCNAQDISPDILKPDADWIQQASGGRMLTFLFPGDADGNHVLMVIGAGGKRTGTFDGWVKEQVSGLAGVFGTLRSDQGFNVVIAGDGGGAKGPLVEDNAVIDADDGFVMKAQLFAHSIGNSWQPVAVLRAESMPANDPRVAMAREKIEFLRGINYVNLPQQPAASDSSAAPAPPAPAVASQQAPEPAPPPAPVARQRTCHTVTRYRMETHTQLQCPIGFTCSFENYQVPIPYEVEECN